MPHDGELVAAVGRTLGDWNPCWTTVAVYGDDECGEALNAFASWDLEEDETIATARNSGPALDQKRFARAGPTLMQQHG